MISNLIRIIVIVLTWQQNCFCVTSVRGDRFKDKNWHPPSNNGATTTTESHPSYSGFAGIEHQNYHPISSSITVVLTQQCVSSNLSKNQQYDHRGARILHTQYPKVSPSYLTIKLPKGSTCFKAFEEENCDGAFLEFFDVKQETKTVRLNSEGAIADQTRLLNFNLVPASLQPCSESDNTISDKTDELCNTEFSVELLSNPLLEPSKFKISNDNCKNLLHKMIPTHQRQQAELKVIREVDYSHRRHSICLDFFALNDCFGNSVRLFIPSSSNFWQDDLSTYALIWEYYSGKTGGPIVDMNIDIKSFRKCSICSESNTEDSPLVSSSSNMPDKSFLSDQEDWSRCKFETCTDVTAKINKSKASHLEMDKKHCFFFFNDTKCSFPPVSVENTTMNTLETLLEKFSFFQKWSLADCTDTRLNEGVKECVHPFNGAKGLEAVLQSFESSHSNGWQTIFLVLAVLLSIFMLLVVVVMLILLRRKKQKIRAIRQSLTPVKRQYYMSQAPARNLAVHQSDAIEENDYVDDITGLRALCTSFADGFEIPRDRINIGNIRDSTANIIGVGEFSIAFKGRLEPEGRTVAVKTMKSGQATTRSVKGALRECQHFKQLGKNSRVLEFLGVCTENVNKGELFVVMAFCENGSVRGFLVQQKNHFTSLVQDGEWVKDGSLEKALTSKFYVQTEPPVSCNTLQLFKWCLEVADVMEFLAVRKIVHVSLSARNVLLDENFSTKLSDFHLAKAPGDVIPNWTLNTINKTNINKERMVPWRWYAIESLLDDVFNTQSDVWTFGVFVWEVFSLGATPYQDFSYGSEFTLCIKHGYRLQAPNFAPLECYQLMLTCWYDASEKRPSFSTLKEKLDEMTPKKNVPISPGPFQIIRSLSKVSDK